MAEARSYTGGRFMLDLGGEMAGFIKKVSGGVTKGEVATHDLGPDNIQKKHISTITYEPFTVEVGMGMSKGFYDWIKASFDKGHITRNGALIAADFDYNAKSVREFMNAYIAEVSFPAFDGSSKEPAYMTVKFDPEQIFYSPGDGNKLKGELAADVQKKWLCSNFRFSLGDLPCSRVAKIDSFTWKQSVIKDEVGAFRSPTKHPAKVEVPNLKLTISMADIEPWSQWHKSFIIDGNCTEADELTGGIEFLGPDMNTTLATLNLDHVGLISLEQEAQEANKEGVARFNVELYVESMALEVSEMWGG